MTVNEACRDLRKSREVTQQQFALMSGLGRGAIAMFETGKSHSLETTKLYLSYFGDVKLTDNLKLSEWIDLMGR